MPGRVNTVALHPLLAFKPDTYNQGSSYYQCVLEWDVRSPPHTAQIVPTSAAASSSHPPPSSPYIKSTFPAPKSSTPLPRPITPAELSQPATTPPVRSLNLTCGLLPPEWRIRATTSSSSSSPHNTINPHCTTSPFVTIADVLSAIHALLSQPVSHAEWERLAPKENERVARTFHARWKTAADGAGQAREYYGGVRRVDWVLHATAFAGLTYLPVGHGGCDGIEGRKGALAEAEAVITLRRGRGRSGEKKGAK